MKKLYFALTATLLLASAAEAQKLPGKTIIADAPAPGRVAPKPSAFNPDSVFVNPQVLPQFTGGKEAMLAFLGKNLRFPEQARRMHASGQVFVRFIISKEGKISDVLVLKGPGYGFNEEAERLVWFMPPWQPGRQNGQAVRTACTLPISFQ